MQGEASWRSPCGLLYHPPQRGDGRETLHPLAHRIQGDLLREETRAEGWQLTRGETTEQKRGTRFVGLAPALKIKHHLLAGQLP